MLSIKGTENGSFIELHSPEIADLIANIQDYESIEIKGKYNCDKEFSLLQDLNIATPCNFGAGGIVYNVSLDFIKQSTFSINKIAIKNTATDTELSLNTAITFDAYKAQCPSGCPLENVTSYETIFNTSYRSLLLNNGLDVSNLQINICGDLLQITGLPSGYVPTIVGYSNGASDSFDNGFSNNKISLTDSLVIHPSFFGIVKYLDGIYGFKVKITDKNGNTTEIENCYFFDVLMKCKVAAKAEYILEDNTDEYSKNLAKDLLIAHYALVNSSNCGGCNCIELCSLYKNLELVLSNGNTNFNNQIIETDCGCSNG
jgi:hypothetical protein